MYLFQHKIKIKQTSSYKLNVFIQFFFSVISADVLLERHLVAKLLEYTCNYSLVYEYISWINKLLVSIVDSYLDPCKYTIFYYNRLFPVMT